jgi:hypothetical protein
MSKINLGGNRMTAHEIWMSFRNKLIDDSLCEEDFTYEMRYFFMNFLTGPETLSRRTKYFSAPAQYFETETKAIVLLKCPDDNYRFDFIKIDDRYTLAFIECITLPVSDINALPYSDFTPLPEKETYIRREKEISKTIWLYCKLKELLGRSEAIKVFMDGNGENIGARSWVPFYDQRLAYIVYAAWIENRINGEHITITEFSDNRSVLLLKDHIWKVMYTMTGHLRTQLDFDEYMWFFEEIWQDRARASGWTVDFSYEGDDTMMTFGIS